MTVAMPNGSDGGDRPSEEPLMVFSSDSHVGPRAEDLRPYCEKKYLEQYDEFVSAMSPAQAIEAMSLTFSEAWLEGRARNDTAGHYDVHVRLREMDRDGVSGGVLFHDTFNGHPFPFDYLNNLGNGMPMPEAQELSGVGRRMYNRWLADFCSVEPERHVGLAQLPMWDIPAAIEELEYAASIGLRGVNFPAPSAPGMVMFDDPSFEDFWAASAALDMPLVTHIGAFPPVPKLSGILGHQVGLLDTTDWGQRTIWIMTLNGVFERHPGVKLIVTEHSGADWDEMNAKMDSIYYTPVIKPRPDLPHPPSYYTRTNVWIGNSFQSRFEAVEVVEHDYQDRFLWGSDYPHPEGTWSNPISSDSPSLTRIALAHTYHELPIESVRRLVGGNILDCYAKLDGQALRKVAARIGPTIEEINTEPDLSQFPDIPEIGTLAFRTSGGWH